MFEYLTFGLCILIIAGQYLMHLKSIYKISYYETRLKNNGIDIEAVKNKSLWSMLTEE